LRGISDLLEACEAATLEAGAEPGCVCEEGALTEEGRVCEKGALTEEITEGACVCGAV